MRVDLSQWLSPTTIPPDWIIPDLLYRGALVVLGGEAGVGKSVFGYNLSVCLATGTPFLDRYPTTPKRVVYFDQENSEADAREYLNWAWRGLGKVDPERLVANLRIEHFSLGTKAGWAATMHGALKEHHADFFMVDTATPAFGVQDENSNAEAAEVINRLRELQYITSPPLGGLILKHATIDHEQGRKTLRGAKTWHGAVDNIWFHIRRQGQPTREGLSATTIEPAKPRAFGLRSPLIIRPRFVDDRTALVLTAEEK